MVAAGAEGPDRFGGQFAQSEQGVDVALARIAADFTVKFRAMDTDFPMSPSARMRGCGKPASTSIAARTESGLAL